MPLRRLRGTRAVTRCCISSIAKKRFKSASLSRICSARCESATRRCETRLPMPWPCAVRSPTLANGPRGWRQNAPDDPGRLVIQRHWIPAFAGMTDSAFAFQEASELLRARRMAELAQRLRLDLTDALARDVELLADLFERMVGLH